VGSSPATPTLLIYKYNNNPLFRDYNNKNMPNKKSAKKELRKSVKRQAQNNSIKAKAKDLIKNAKKQIEAKNVEVKKDFSQVVKAIDKMAKKGIIKKNTASRKKSRLQKKINKI